MHPTGIIIAICNIIVANMYKYALILKSNIITNKTNDMQYIAQHQNVQLENKHLLIREFSIDSILLFLWLLLEVIQEIVLVSDL